MKTVALYLPEHGQNMYTHGALRAIMRHYGVEEAPIETADAVWFSCCDPDNIVDLVRIRKIAGERPLIMGGFEGYAGVPYLAWADAVVVGEGATFIREWGRNPKEAINLPCVLTMDNLENGEIVKPDYEVPYSLMPIVRLPGGNRFYYLSGRGCRGKCRFCMTSWTQPYTNCPEKRIMSVIRYVESRNGKLTLISNDSFNVKKSHVVNAQSVRVVDYLKEPERYKSSMLHFGIEFWDEKSRARNGKPISDNQISELLKVTKEQRQKIELFFIVGAAGNDNVTRWTLDSVRDFAESVIPVSVDKNPHVHVKLTYLDPCPHTPMSGDKVDPEYCSPREVFKIFNGKNKRFRVFPTRSAGRSAWRTVFHRCTPGEAIRLGPEPKGTNRPDAFEKFREHLAAVGLEHKLEGRGVNEDVIKVRIR
jgi:radical SAM superfamily enzyme YgiQ (UPF0313 family)